jgi:D-alanyl-D-alanine carboxypeptidase/D-alanyl-D-alanine-endopeptidase (penicillin-binding protein 4)
VTRARLVALASVAVALSAAVAVAAPTLAEQLSRALSHRGLRGAQVSALAVRAGDGAVLFEQQPDRALIPASNAKLLTAVAALAELGPTHRFTTQVLAEAPPDTTGAVGTLALRGGGDPSLTSEQLWRLAADLRRTGLSQVRGDLILDDSLFDQRHWHPAWGEITSRAFHAPVSALSANYGHFVVEVAPGAAGGPARVGLDPPIPYLRLTNQARTVARSSKAGALSVVRRARAGADEVVVSGSIRSPGEAQFFLLSVSDPVLYAGSLLRAQLESVGISIGGAVRRAAVPDGFVEIYTFDGKSLGEITRLYMKHSNNNIAESLFKTLGARNSGQPGSWENGSVALRRILTGLGIDPTGFSLVDGSGLSRDNRISARTLVHALEIGRGSFDFGPELAAALPIAAADGTMKRRVAGAAGAVRAKTGLLNGVTGLSGYARTADGVQVTFSILANDYKNGDHEAMAALDQFVEVLTTSHLQKKTALTTEGSR